MGWNWLYFYQGSTLLNTPRGADEDEHISHFQFLEGKNIISGRFPGGLQGEDLRGLLRRGAFIYFVTGGSIYYSSSVTDHFLLPIS